MSTIKAKTIQPLSDSDTLVLRTGASDSLTIDTSGNATIRGELTVDGIAIGQGPGDSYTNTRVGSNTFNSISSGAWNTALGRSALSVTTSGYYNTGLGAQALLNHTTGFENTAVGLNSGLNITVGNCNTAIGSQAGPNAGTLNNTTCIGRNAVASADNAIAIGFNSSATTANSVYLGNASTTSLYMGNGSVVAPLYGARAWVTLNTGYNTAGVLDSTATNRLIYGSGNVSSVLRVISGADGTSQLRFRVNFTVPMPHANYAVVGVPTAYTSNNATGNMLVFHTSLSNTPKADNIPSNKTTTSFDITLMNSSLASSAGYDNSYLSLVVFC